MRDPRAAASAGFDPHVATHPLVAKSRHVVGPRRDACLGRRTEARAMATASFGRSVVKHPPSSGPAAGVFLPLAPGVGLCCVSRAGLFLPRTTAALAGPWALPSRPARRHRGPRLRRLRPGLRSQARRACYRWSSTRPWCSSPPPSLRRLARSTSGARRPHDGVLKRALGRLLRPTPFLPDLGGVCQATIVCIAGAGRRRYRGLRHPWATRKRSKRGKRGTAVADLAIGREARFR